MKNHFNAVLAVLLLATVACEPVFAIGWREIFVIFLLGGLLLGPPLYRFLRRLEKFLKQREK